MKRMKKLASLVLAMVMALAMTATAFAADNELHKITVTQNTDDKTLHQYAAYQIFAGDLKVEEDGTKVLSNIIWGSGVDGENLLVALKANPAFGVEVDNLFANCTTAAQVAEVLAGEQFESSTKGNSTLTDAFARTAENYLTAAYESTSGTGDVEIEVMGSGYYLVKDTNESVEAGGAYTRALLQVVGDAAMTVKSEVPGGDKQIYVDANTTGDANNASIGSHVSYKITSKVPNYAGYDYYYFVMNDTLSEGLTFDGKDSITVTIGGKTLVQGTDYYVYTKVVEVVDEKEVVTDDNGGKTFRLAFDNIMQYEVGNEIVVTYSATVNDQAIIGTTGNPNTWTLQYSNNPDDTFDRHREDKENKPGLPKDEENEPLGETPEEKTLTYVTELDITKYANSVADNHLLAGAEFTLTGTSKQVVLSTVDYYEASENGTYYLLLDGTYTETAPTGTEYVEIGVGTKDTTTGYIKIGDDYVVPENRADYEGETLYKLVKGTAASYADVNTKYEKKQVKETSYIDADVSIELTTGADGKISFKDLGAGTYTLTETVTPAGFNTLDPITFTITFTPPAAVNDGTEKCTWTIDWTGAKDTGFDENNEGTPSGIFAADVINNSGSLLPSTGGIGTTIFTIVGAALIIGAGVLLVVKKRMSKN